MKLNSKIRWLVVFPATIVGVIFIIVIAAVVYFYPNAVFNMRTVRPVVGFEYKNTLICTILYTTNRGGVSGINSLPSINFTSFVLTGLDTDIPQVLVDGNSIGGWRAIYNSDQYITVQADKSGPSTDIIGLMKNNGTFVRTITGLQAGDWKFHYALAQKGRCQ